MSKKDRPLSDQSLPSDHVINTQLDKQQLTVRSLPSVNASKQILPNYRQLTLRVLPSTNSSNTITHNRQLPLQTMTCGLFRLNNNNNNCTTNTYQCGPCLWTLVYQNNIKPPTMASADTTFGPCLRTTILNNQQLSGQILHLNLLV